MIITFLLYNLTLISSVLLVYLSERRFDIYLKKFLLFSALISLSILPALRYNIGYDYMSYVDIYNNIDKANIEIGFYYLIKLLIFFDLPAQSFFIVTSLLIYGILLCNLPKKYGYLIIFGFITLFYFQSLSVIRTALVYVLLLSVTLKYIENRNICFYVLWIVIFGFFLHRSAFVFLIVPLLGVIIPTIYIYRWNVIIVCVLIFLIPFGEELIKFIIDMPVLDWLGFRKYIGGYLFVESNVNTGLGILLKITCLLLPVFLVKDILNKNNKYIIAIFIIILCILSIIMASKIKIFNRLHYLFSIAYPLSLYLLAITSNYYRKLLIGFIMLSYLIFFEIDLLNNTTDKCDSIRISPYISIFNQNEDNGYPVNECKIILQRNIK